MTEPVHEWDKAYREMYISI